MSHSWTPIADGEEGILQILENLNDLKELYGSRPEIRAAALAIVGANYDDDDKGNAQKLAKFVRNAVRYVKDPLNSELVQTPDILLLQINDFGRASGDCDDHVLLFCALAESLGIFTAIAAVKTPGAPLWDHVIAVALVDGQKQDIDLCAKRGASPIYRERLQLELN